LNARGGDEGGGGLPNCFFKRFSMTEVIADFLSRVMVEARVRMIDINY